MSLELLVQKIGIQPFQQQSKHGGRKCYDEIKSYIQIKISFQLLMFICGTKEKYRELRDLHAVEMHLNSVMKLCVEGGLPVDQVMSPGVILPHDTLLSIVSSYRVMSPGVILPHDTLLNIVSSYKVMSPVVILPHDTLLNIVSSCFLELIVNMW